MLAWVHPRIFGKARLCALPHYGLDPKLNAPTAPGGSLVLLQCNQPPGFEAIATRHTETGAEGVARESPGGEMAEGTLEDYGIGSRIGDD